MEKKIVGNSWYCTFVLHFTIHSTILGIPMQVTCLNPMIPVLQRVYNETYQRRHNTVMPESTWQVLLTLTMSMLLAGAFLGAMSFKLLLNLLTRKQVMFLSHGFNILGGIIMAAGMKGTGSYEAVIIGRFISGLFVGIGYSIAPVIVHEITVSPRRRFYGSVIAISSFSGLLVGIFFGWDKIFGTYERYVGVFLVPIAMSTIYLTSSSYWITETPLQIAITSGKEEAMSVLIRLRSPRETQKNQGISEELEEEIRSMSSDDNVKIRLPTFMEAMKTPQYRRHLAVFGMLFTYMNFSGVNVILFYSDTIFLSAGLDADVVTIASMGVFIIAAIVMTIAAVLTTYIDPKVIIIFAGGCMVVGHVLMTASIATYKEVPAMSICSIVAMCIFLSGFALHHLVVHILTGAICIDKTRPLCANVGVAWCWLTSWFVGFISNYLQEWLSPYDFLIWMGFCIVFTVYVIFFIPTTRGQTPEKVQEFFKDK